MDNVKDDLRTHINIRDVTDLTRGRTIWRNLVQTRDVSLSRGRERD